MLDAKLLRNEINKVAAALKTRGYTLEVEKIDALEEERKQLQIKTQNLQNERNEKSKHIGQAKSRGENVEPLINEMTFVSASLKKVEDELEILQQKLHDIYATIPNIPDSSVPVGKSEEDNVEVRRVGTPRTFNFTPKDHVTLGEQLKMLDFNAAAKLSGSRFVVMHDALAKLQRALIRFMLDVHTKEHGYKEVYVPYLVTPESLFSTGQLPKFKEDQFWTHGETSLGLIPTAEVPVTNLVRQMILDADELPLKWVAHTPCFRSEAGSYGKDTRGIIRQHQFEKVEMVQIVSPEKSGEVLEELTSHAEAILKKLELPYRVVSLCTGDIGFAAAKTYDLEVWLPAQNCYREISSCSNFKDFQARRLQARVRTGQDKPILVHTLNGSGLAVGRTLVAIMENYQDEKGIIHLPKVLWNYFEGEKIIPL